MNKKFSTLLASVLLASAFSTASAVVQKGVLNDGSANSVKQGDYVYLGLDNTPNSVLVNIDGTLTGQTIANPNAPATKISDIHGQMWQVASVKYDPSFGFPTYQFIDRVTGEYLAIKLVTDTKDHVSSDAAKLDAGGNKDWRFDSNGNLYAYRADVDSVYTLKLNNLNLVATKGGADKIDNGSTQKLYVERYTTARSLKAEDLNALMATGKLYFNGEDVSEGNDNILTGNPWKAYAEGAIATSTNFFLMRADKDSVTSDNKNPNLLMVDTAMYAGGNYHKLVIDTLALTKAQAALLKDQTGAKAFEKGNYKPFIAKAARQISAALFSASYTLYNDSVSLIVEKAPSKNKYRSTITDYTYTYGIASEDDNKDVAITLVGSDYGVDADAYLANMVGYNEAAAATSGAAPINNLAKAVKAWETQALDVSTNRIGSAFNYEFAKTLINTTTGAVAASQPMANSTAVGTKGVLTLAKEWLEGSGKTHPKKDLFDKFVKAAEKLRRLDNASANGYYHMLGYGNTDATGNKSAVALKQLANTKVLTIADNATTGAAVKAAGFIAPLIQPYATTGGDAVIDGNGKVYFIQVAAASETTPTLRAGLAKDKYLVVNPNVVPPANALEQVDEVDASDVYAQWAFIQGATGSYQIVNRGSGKILYSGPVNKGDKADTYKLGDNTYKLAGIDLSDAVIYDEKGTKYDYTGAFYAGPADGVSQSFAIAPASQFLTTLGLQFNKDSVLVLGEATNAPQWYLEAGTPKTYGYSVPGLPELKKVTYKIYTKDGENVKYYVYPTASNPMVFAITKEDSKEAKTNTAEFEFRTVAKDTYLFLVPSATPGSDEMATINLNMTQPVIEVSAYSTKRQDYFTITKSEYSNYRTLTAEDGVLGNATIYMENEPNRFLYENTQNIVANNGNKIAKDSLNFLGIFNAAAMVKNAAIYVDTAYVDRKDNTRPQYMFAVGVTEVAATEGHACTESGKHFDANGKETTADKCVHATPGTEGYKTGRYLVSLKDSVPTGFAAKHPTLYDGNIRLAFVEAKHIKDTLEIANSKFTVDEHVKDSIKIKSDLEIATFALKIVDQATKSFVLETKDAYVRILNGVPVLTGDIKEAAVLNISATEAEATANEAIEAAGVQVVGGQGVVTVQGAAGKVITVANILGQTIANQVATSDNVTIAAPTGVVVVAVDGDATKVVVK